MNAPDLPARFDDESGVLQVSGDLEGAALDQFEAALARHAADVTRVLVVDLSAVAYLPSHAVGVLARARKGAAAVGSRLEIVARSGTIAHRVLDVCGMPHTTT